LTKTFVPFGWKVVLSILPYVLVFQMILGLQLSSKYAAPAGLLLTIIIGTHFFEDSSEFLHTDLPGMMGRIALVITDRLLWTIFDYAANMFAAMFFLEVLRGWGIDERLKKEFEAITNDPQHLLLLVLFSFGHLLGVVAPGGTNYLIAGSILIRIGLKPEITEEEATRLSAEYDQRHKNCIDKNCTHPTATTEHKLQVDTNNRIGAICLFGNALSGTFNLLGVCVIATASMVTPLDLDAPAGLNEEGVNTYAALEIVLWYCAMMFPLAVLSPLITVIIFSKK
jgi:L-lactate permease